MRVNELLNLQFPLHKNVQVILAVLNHIVELEQGQDLFDYFMEHARDSKTWCQAGWVYLKDFVQDFESLLKIFGERDVLN